jgi:hypothetical protein
MTEKQNTDEPEENPLQPPTGPRPDPKTTSNEFIVRAIFWGWMLLSFFATCWAIVIFADDSWFLFFVCRLWGITLVVVFFYALMKRSSGQPLSWAELGKLFRKVTWRTFLFMIGAPIVLGLAAFLALWCICALSR